MMKVLHIIVQTLIFLTLAAHAASADAQAQSGSELQSRLANYFETLTRNRVTYNLYNDSIYTIKGRDPWTAFFLRRAAKNHEIYNSNKRILKEIDSIFHDERVKKTPDDYNKLYQELEAFTDNLVNDPFMSMHLGKLLEEYYDSGKCPTEKNNIMSLCNNMAYNAYQIAIMGNDTSFAKIGYDYAKRNLDERNKDLPLFQRCRLLALSFVSTTTYYKWGAQTFDEMHSQAQLFYRLMHSDSLDMSVFRDKAQYRQLLTNSNIYESNVIRNVYLPDSTVMPKQHADSLMRDMVEQIQKVAHTGTNNFTKYRMYVMMAKLGDITYDEALARALSDYEDEWHSKYKKGRLTPSDLGSYALPFYTLFYFNDMAKTTEAQKRKVVKRMCHDIEDAYSRRIDQQNDNRYIKYLATLTTYERITNHLTPAERIHFLNSLNVTTQVTTYAHSVHVGVLAVILMKSIIDHQPQLLTGMLGCQSASDVRKKANELISYIYEAATYHDLGKNSITAVVNNDYRPIYDDEYAIIKRHPALGLKYLELAPELAKYHDTTLGHHKWYNGKGGYPDSFDNTKSPYRTLIDIITVADCMQAATERVGRNYKGDKTFDMVMAEFRRQAGTRYNPDIVRFIDEHQQVGNTLRKNLDTGWLDIYYDIYQKFME